MPWLLLALALVSAVLLVERRPGGGLRVSRRLVLVRDLLRFVRERKAWWMVPLVLILAVLGTFAVIAEQSVLLPFLYVMF